jgi:hypothetical protein
MIVKLKLKLMNDAPPTSDLPRRSDAISLMLDQHDLLWSIRNRELPSGRGFLKQSLHFYSGSAWLTRTKSMISFIASGDPEAMQPISSGIGGPLRVTYMDSSGYVYQGVMSFSNAFVVVNIKKIREREYFESLDSIIHAICPVRQLEVL